MRRLVILSLLTAACTPQNATLVEGSYIAFISEGTSLSLAKEEVAPEDWGDYFSIDCREFEDEEDEALRLDEDDNVLDICKEKKGWPPEVEQWGFQSAYYVVEEDLDPWRGEAVITSEGDLQVGFHHRLPGGADFRFAFAVDPDFQPMQCIQNESGEGVEYVPMDGDWVANWSTELEGIAGQPGFEHLEGFEDGRLFFLNAFGYQRDPLAPDEGSASYWYFPEEWEAGTAEGKFSEELIYHRTGRWAEPWVYNFASEDLLIVEPVQKSDIWWCELEEGADPAESECLTEEGGILDRVQDAIDLSVEEFSLMTTPPDAEEPVFTYSPIKHDNLWRQPDGFPGGFDGWGEMHYTYVVLSADSVIEPGGSARGAFGLVLDSLDSTSRVYVKGTFEIDKIKKDKWITEDLRVTKAEENDPLICGTPYSQLSGGEE